MPSNYVLLNRVEVTSSSSSITFNNIPQSGYTDLKIVLSARSDGTSFSTSPWQNIGITINSTSPTSYKQMYATAGGRGSDSQSAGIWATNNNATVNTFSNDEIYLTNYLSSSAKTISVENVTENNGSDFAIVLWTALFSTVTSPISTITLSPVSGSFLKYSTFSLYGIAAVGVSPLISPYAAGGDSVTNDGTYWYHTFLSSGKFTPLKPLTCNYLVVGGGGGGGSNYRGGGGGAGGLRSTVTATGGGGTLESAISVTKDNPYTITVGSGGAANNNGTNSTFSTITALGGGSGGNGNNNGTNVGYSGGSGGGGCGVSGGDLSGGAGTANQGYAGGNAVFSSSAYGGGGGGAGASGTNPNGGNGVAISALASPTGTGSSNYYAGGGGGGGFWSGGSPGSPAPGGAGGGGAGSKERGGNVSATAGSYATGGGGGGGAEGAPGAAGGSGLVIIRYAM